MARQLWLLRHAEAEPHGARPDAERALTQRGERQARIVGRAIERLGIHFEEGLYSPKVRAAQTASIAAQSSTNGLASRLREHPPLAGPYDLTQALSDLSTLSADGRLLLVGHEPYLSRLAGELTGAMLDLKKCGLAGVRLDGGSGELIVLLRPHELALLVGSSEAEV